MRKLVLIALCVFAGFGLVAPQTASAVSVTVHARHDTVLDPLDTGLTVNAGDLLTITADPTDIWGGSHLAYHQSTAAGVQDIPPLPGGGGGYTAPVYTFGNLTTTMGTLVGLLDGVFFKIGLSFSQVMQSSGTLYLLYWDEKDQYFNNGGTVDVELSTAPTPIPGAVWLLGSGLLGLVGLRRKMKS